MRVPATSSGLPQMGGGPAVPEKVTGPLGPRRNIASELRRLRAESGKRLNDVATTVMFSPSKLSRLENAMIKPNARDIKDLIDFYGIKGTSLAGHLMQWVQDAQRSGWWSTFDDEVVGGMEAHLAYETYATVARIYTLPFLPVLLQTPDYAAAVFRDMEQRPEEKVEQLLQVRRKRQEILTRRDDLPPLRLIAVTYESTLRQMVGSPEIMRDQLDELITRSDVDNIQLHVLPFAALPRFTMTCMWAYFEYQDSGGSDIVHIETHAGFFTVDGPDQLRRYREAHDALVAASLSVEESANLIAEVRDDMFSSK
jgi:transcriptional regulator with XRE-family HTH domain